MQVELTEKEWELISTIRNYKNTYPRSKQLEIYIDTLLDELTD